MKRYFSPCSAALLLAVIVAVISTGCRKTAESIKPLLEQEYRHAAETVEKISRGSSSANQEYIFIYNKKGELINWGNNTTPIVGTVPGNKQPLIHLPNGIYLNYQKELPGSQIIYLKCIQHSNVQRSAYLRYPNEIDAFIALEQYPGLDRITFRNQLIYVAPLAFNFSDWQVFNPEFYASSSLNPSLGHLLINLILAGILLLFLEKFLLRKIPINRYGTIIGGLIICVSGHLFTGVIISLVDDGKLNFDFFNYTQLQPADFFAQLAIVFTSYLFLRIYFWYYRRFQHSDQLFLLVPLMLIYNLVEYFLHTRSLLETNWFVPLLFLPFIKSSEKKRYSLQYFIASMFLVVGITIIVSHHDSTRKDREQRLIAEKLSRNDDPVAEFLISENIVHLEKKLAIEGNPLADQATFLDEYLFNGYLAKYKVDTVFHPGKSSQFSFTFNGQEFTYTNRFNVVGFGFPELLSDVNEVAINKKGFAEAIYDSDKLVKNYGNYPYPRSLKVFTRQASADNLNSLYAHYFYKDDAQTIIVSYREKTWIELFAMLTYIFLITQLALFLYLASIKGPSYQMSLKQRIQFTVIGIVVLAVALFTGMAHYYILKEFKAKNKILLSEKIDSVIIELNQKISENSDLNKERGNLEKILRKFSSVFFTDITLYDTKGNLIATSQPALFEKYILSEKIHPVAFDQLKRKAANIYIQEENLGQLQYLSAYRPFVNQQNLPIAYVNLPYFAKQTELDEQLSEFLVTVINAMVILLTLALAAAIFLSEKITAPLKMLQKRVEDIDLLNSSVPIEYHTDDEIGSLVNAYNNKVRELGEKAEELAQNQKELAWREMAKQVAHEIKNPLTPMKLSAQHLQRTIANDDTNWKERINNFINGLVEQINTLTKIANEFSNYAQLPKSNAQLIDVRELLLNALSLYVENDRIELQVDFPEEPVKIWADKDLLLSVFNNLLKNAEQAIESNYQSGRIKIGEISTTMLVQESKVQISFGDNGVGIDEVTRESIFMPNFTTKSSGMGLGLAMTRQIVHQFGGRIWFEAGATIGTNFFVELPIPAGNSF